MEEQKKVIVAGAVFILLIVAAAIIYYFFIYHKPEKTGEMAPVVQEQPVVEEKIQSEEEKVEPLDVSLEESDGVVRELAGELSTDPIFAKWLLSEELIRKWVAAVDNIANGLSPGPQIDFFKPEGDFEVTEEAGEYYIDPDSYERYDPVAEVFASLDSQGCVNLYRKLKPAIQEAYKDLGYPNKDFDGTLKKAMMVLLKVPVVTKNIRLEKSVVTYMMADADLESLDSAQKHLLRMGPGNVRIIQTKLRELAELLGFME